MTFIQGRSSSKTQSRSECIGSALLGSVQGEEPLMARSSPRTSIPHRACVCFSLWKLLNSSSTSPAQLVLPDIEPLVELERTIVCRWEIATYRGRIVSLRVFSQYQTQSQQCVLGLLEETAVVEVSLREYLADVRLFSRPNILHMSRPNILHMSLPNTYAKYVRTNKRM